MSSKPRTFWNADIDPEIKEYLQNKLGLSAGDCLREYYRIRKSTELTGLEQEKEDHLKRVAQIDENLSQLKNEYDTEWAVCDTIFSELSKQGIEKDGTVGWDINNITLGMRERIQIRLDKNGIKNISVDDLIEHYTKKVK